MRKKWVRYLIGDIVIAALCLGVLLAHFYVIPRKGNTEGTTLLDMERVTASEFELPGEKQTENQGSERSGSEKSKAGKKGTGPKKPGGSNPGAGNTGTKQIDADEAEAENIAEQEKTDSVVTEYVDDTMQITITETQLGEGADTVTYYTADVYLTSTDQLKTAFAEGTYGKNMRESTLQMAGDNGAILAISGDSYGNNETGVVVRNGKLYRSDTNDGEICVLCYDGTMKVYTGEEFNAQNILEEEVWQVWNFGPVLLEEGEIKDSFQTTSYLSGEHPRTAVGYISPGHYVFVVVDGRDDGYSRGATLSELAQIMKDQGCVLAYNLDGGKSSAMVFNGEYVNQPADGGRDISDIIYIQVGGTSHE